MKRAPVVEILHGETIRDPYRWLEERDLPETQQWINEQHRRCAAFFDGCREMDHIRARVRAYLDVESWDQPARIGDRFFYRRRQPGQEQAAIYVQADGNGERLLVDPTENGPFISTGIHCISDDAALLAFELKRGGEDKVSIHVADVRTARVLPDSLPRGLARGFVFSSDETGFFYCHETSAATREHTIALHLFGDPAADRVVFRAPRSDYSRLVLAADVSRLGAILTRYCGTDIRVSLWVAQRTSPKNWSQIFAERRMPFFPMLREGRIFALSYVGSPNGRLIEIDGQGREIRTLISEAAGAIRQILFAGNRIYTTSLKQLTSSVHCWNIAGEDLGPLSLPSSGTTRLLPSYCDRQDGFFLYHEDFAQPPIIYEFACRTSQLGLWRKRELPFPPQPLHIEHSRYPSRDGSQIPITLVSHSQRPKVPSAAIMTSYGGFGISSTPQFSVLVTILLKAGAVFALPHIRGGSELGQAWHEAARGRKRQTSFDDFLSAAQWLCDQGITSPCRLAIFGGSNSGLLVGVAITQRPEIFCAALCLAPLLDMVRYESFDEAGKWRHEYGSIENLEDFRALYAYSPYHHVQEKVDYPAIMLVAGDQDDRCNPAHVRKMAARLQDRRAQKQPVLVDYSENRGHSPVLPLSFRIEALARRIAFLCQQLKLTIRI